jgi:hypothetical protein
MDRTVTAPETTTPKVGEGEDLPAWVKRSAEYWNKAQDELSAAERERDELRKALLALADAAEAHDGHGSGPDIYVGDCRVCVAMRLARAVLAAGEQK